jgi:peptidoglycan hydrolase CwlO-like protein
MGLFKNESKKTELEKNMEELNLNAGTLQELQQEKAKFEGALRVVAIELELGEDSSLTKRLRKFEKKVNELQKEIEGLNTRQAELNKAIAEEKARLKQEAIEEAGKAYENSVYLKHKRTLANNEFRRLVEGFLESTTGNYIDAVELKKLAGVKWNEGFDAVEHAPYKEAELKASRAGTEKAQKEFDKLMKQINEFLEKDE